jgi:hypothetical protein
MDSEQDSIDPDDPKLDNAPLRLSERAARLGPSVSQAARLGPIKSATSRPALLASKTINEPPRRTRDPDQRAALLSVTTRVAAVAGVVTVVALLFVIVKPASRQSIAGPHPSETTGSIPQAKDAESRPPPAELKAPLVPSPSQPATHEQSLQLLERLLQWRERASATNAPQ